MSEKDRRGFGPRLKAQLTDMHITLPRYLAVSFVGIVIGTVALWFFKDVVGLFYLVAGSLGAFLAVINDFSFHEVWTFSHLGKERYLPAIARRFGKFVASKALGFLVALAALAFFTEVLGFYYLVSNLFAIGAAFVCNYAISSHWVWTRRE